MDTIFVLRLEDIIGLIVLGLIVLFFLLLGGLILFDKAKRAVVKMLRFR